MDAGADDAAARLRQSQRFQDSLADIAADAKHEDVQRSAHSWRRGLAIESNDRPVVAESVVWDDTSAVGSPSCAISIDPATADPSVVSRAFRNTTPPGGRTIDSLPTPAPVSARHVIVTWTAASLVLRSNV